MEIPVAPPVSYDFNEEQMALIAKTEVVLNATRFGNRTNKNNFKKSTGYGQSEAFGFIRRRNRVPGPCRNNKRYPELWKVLQELGAKMPLSYDAVQVNFNCACNPHKDEGNLGLSLLTSGGSYTGGELHTEYGDFAAKYRGVIFDGSRIEHSNLPHTGHKWSIVFFTIQIPEHQKHHFPEGFRTTFPNYRDEFLPHIPHVETLYFPNGITKNKGKPTEYKIMFS
jgi:hypothetical protein